MILASPTLLIEQSPGDESRLHKLAEGHRALVAAHVVHEPGPLAVAAREEAVEAARSRFAPRHAGDLRGQ